MQIRDYMRAEVLYVFLLKIHQGLVLVEPQMFDVFITFHSESAKPLDHLGIATCVKSIRESIIAHLPVPY